MLALPAVAQQSLTLASGRTITTTVTATTTILHLSGHGRVRLRRDATVAQTAAPPTLKLIAEVPGTALLLTDTYPSLPAGLSRCQAGEEQFLRVIAIAGDRPVETGRLKLASCRDTIELADPGLTWSASTHTLTIHWLSVKDAPGHPGTTTLRIGPDGRPSPITPTL